MLIAKRPGWENEQPDYSHWIGADDLEAVGVQCCACGEWVHVWNAEYDKCEQEWICDECLDGHDEDDEDEKEPEEPGETFAANWRLLWLQTFPGVDEAYRHAWDNEDGEAAQPAS